MAEHRTSWVGDRFGVRLHTGGNGGQPLTEFVELALRRNPRRAHLLVSGVLGKHVPADPRLVHGAGLALGAAVRAALDAAGGAAGPVVLGFAETATGLGHCVAEQLGAPYLHSTRRDVVTAAPLAGFEEEHSHATSHRLLPDRPGLLAGAGPLVLVDDELSTGRTALNTVAALQAVAPRGRYVIAALVDLRSAQDRAAMTDRAAELGVRIDVVASATGSIELSEGFADRAADLVRRLPEVDVAPAAVPADLVVRRDGWPLGVREGGRHGFDAQDVHSARDAAAAVAARVGADLFGDDVLVLGTEELMYAPLLIALELQALGTDAGRRVRVSSTTRSPVLAVDEPGYPIRTVLRFAAHDGVPADGVDDARYVYNVAGQGASDIVLVVDSVGDTAALQHGLLARLCEHAGRVHLVVLPAHVPPVPGTVVPPALPEPLHGPGFGSYAPGEVAWLLTDLAGVELEAPTEEREEAIQSGGAHYAESLPVEFQPDAAYLQLFDAALADSAARIATAVGVVTELVLAERGPGVVLASLARAGTPVGVLMQRWARAVHGAELPHYALSIVRGRGIDTVALRWLAAHHDSDRVVFVDGWTGKGAIAGELAAALGAANTEFGTAFDAALAVLADPGSCVRTFGTREDFLVPSACLNSTVSGLVSRTVLNPRILAPGQFHGAKFYRELAGADVSARFLDAVTDRFAAVADDVAAAWPTAREADREPTWAGWREVQRLSESYGIGDMTLVKPGVGETTRVLLRRVPWKILVRTGAEHELAHVLLLAEQRGVPVERVDGLTYRCVGLIHPRYTRGATGADGRTVLAPDASR